MTKQQQQLQQNLSSHHRQSQKSSGGGGGGVNGPNGGNNNPSSQQQQQQQPQKHTVHWFRKGLRLHDNPALREGLKDAASLRCVFVIDPWFAGSSNVGINKWRFLLQCLEDLDRNLRQLNSRLFVIRGQPADALPKLFKEWGTTCLTFEEDPEPFGKVRDHNISEMCKELNIEVISAVSHTLYKLERIIEKNNGRAPLTYNQFQAIIASMDAPPQPEPAITLATIGRAVTPQCDDHDDKYGVPTLEELGFETEGLKPPIWVGGETEALARLERHLERKAWVASFGRPKMTPQSLLASQTGLSPYLRFGCLSTRLFYYQLTDLYKKIKKAYPPLSLHGQLFWREFFYCAATKNPNFDKMAGNPICVQIPWDRNAEALAKWASGQTGFPWIDAIMTQLREEGWIHHLARHAVACFLTRGDLWISWEEGMKVFEELLLDADWSVNAGMWMWLSCSSFFQQFFHCYCPVKFGRKADPNGDYIRRYLPVLKNFPTRYIHEPWNAPESVQRAARCIIGKNYPLPMVNHAIASRANMERIKQVYQQLAKYRSPSHTGQGGGGGNNLPISGGGTRHGDCGGVAGVEKGGSAIAGVMTAAKVQHMNASSLNDSPSPTTIMTSVNSSGDYMCRSNPSAQSESSKIITYQHQQQDQRQQQQLSSPPGHQHVGGDHQYNSLLSQQGQGQQQAGSAYVTIKPENAMTSTAGVVVNSTNSNSTIVVATANNNNNNSSNDDLMNAHFNTLQDQLNNSMSTLGSGGGGGGGGVEYERNQENLYNSQFKVEYSDNFNSGYGMRNTEFYGRRRDDDPVLHHFRPEKQHQHQHQNHSLDEPSKRPLKPLSPTSQQQNAIAECHRRQQQQQQMNAELHHQQQQQQQQNQQQPMQQSPPCGEEKLTTVD